MNSIIFHLTFAFIFQNWSQFLQLHSYPEQHVHSQIIQINSKTMQWPPYFNEDGVWRFSGRPISIHGERCTFLWWVSFMYPSKILIYRHLGIGYCPWKHWRRGSTWIQKANSDEACSCQKETFCHKEASCWLYSSQNNFHYVFTFWRSLLFHEETDLLLSLINFYISVVFTDLYWVDSNTWKYVKGSAELRKESRYLLYLVQEIKFLH